MSTSDTPGKTFKAYEALLPLKDDPEAFEAKRQELIEQFILAQPEELQENYRKRQWGIDQARIRFTDPHNDMVRMFWVQVAEFQKGLTLLNEPEGRQEPIEKATVLEFKKPDG